MVGGRIVGDLWGVAARTCSRLLRMKQMKKKDGDDIRKSLKNVEIIIIIIILIITERT